MFSPDLLLGRHIIVSGAAGGIGAAAAHVLSASGARLLITDRSSEALATLSDELPGKTLSIAADMRDPDSAAKIVGLGIDEWGQVDGFVGAAGVIEVSPFLDMTLAEWNRVMDINVTGLMTLTQEAGRAMKTTGGSMVLLSSTAAHIGRPNGAHYGASKAAVISLARTAAAALAPRSRVNAVCPGPTLTPMWHGIIQERTRVFSPEAAETYQKERIDNSPLARLAEPIDIANTIVFLISDLARHITGQAITVDGGTHMRS